MKVVILGSSGMLGHVLYRYLESTGKYNLMGVSREQAPGIKSAQFNIETDFVECAWFLEEYKPDVVINCIGVLVQASKDDPTRAVFVNSFWPHFLEDTCRDMKCRLIHISTDCVFDGNAGPYNETDCPTERNWYGRSKALGEVINGKDLTIRTSIIGPELKKNGTGLFEWFMRQTGEVSGYVNVLWNGVTTLELAKQIHTILETNLTGLYHLGANIPIAKGELLMLIQNTWAKTDVTIKPTICSVSQSKVLLNNRIDDYLAEIPEYHVQLEELKKFY
jgi:dTDP-4-dehydrorhamnose reductase